MLPESQLRNVLSQVTPRTMHGTFSRCVGYHHVVARPGGTPSAASPQPIWGMGSRIAGGRFTPRGTFETVYLAEDPITALAEVALVIRHSHAPRATFRTPPWVHVAVSGVLGSVLDLTESNVQAVLGTSRQELTGEWRYTQAQDGEAPTQALGRVEGVCLVVFPERLRPPAHIEVYDPYGNLAQRLP